ncbi:dihydrolipoamide acetyltransferase family protein [Streptomyces sp. A5-4]|uniref:dihydrolipoamide acetyltransferase family protein n=1 Tax=Streptomyces sp. A5-4 TaxID=3384771 RepID=UPI003DA9AEC8
MSTGTAKEQLFRLPDLGEGLTEAEIIGWTVSVGDTVEIDQVVVEVETAKAAVEVPVPFAGTVLHLHGKAGDSVDVGAPLISVGPSADAGAAAAEQYREEEQGGSGNVLIGYGTGHAGTPRRRRRIRHSSPTGSQQAAPAPTQSDSAPPDAAVRLRDSGTQGAPRVLSPLVRKLARDHGIDIAQVTPSGPSAVILRKDIEQSIARSGPPAVPAGSADNSARQETTPGALQADGVERIPLRGLRRAIAEKLTRSRTEIPDATTWVDADATNLLRVKKVLQAAAPDQPLGLLALLARICVSGLQRFPELNSSVDTAQNEIVRYSAVHLGFAAQTPRGLMVPVVRDAHRMTTAQLGAELARLTALARTGSLPPEVLTGGTFTLNNYGVFGVDGSTPIINHPEAAILGIGRIVDKPWVLQGELAVRKVTQLSFTFDHRVCDGGVAGGFLRYVADCVEHPETLIVDL